MAESDDQDRKPNRTSSTPRVKWESEEQMRDALEQAKAELALEGLVSTPEEDELLLKRARGEITHEEFGRRLLEFAKRVKDATR